MSLCVPSHDTFGRVLSVIAPYLGSLPVNAEQFAHAVHSIYISEPSLW
jgi:hypothetical protein